MNLFRSQTLEIDVGGTAWALFAVRGDHRLCQKLATLLKTHPGYRFRPSDEMQFKVPSRELDAALAICNIKGCTEQYRTRLVQEG